MTTCSTRCMRWATWSDVTSRPRPLRSPRVRLAILLFVLNLVLGWPAVALAGAASPWIGAANAAILAGICYAGSWALLAISSALGGPELMADLKARVSGILKRKKPD